MTHFSSFRRLGSLVSLLGLSGFALLGGACQDAGTPGEDVGSDEAALTAEQCDYFDVNGKVQICHELGNGQFKILRLAEQACINAHSAHGGDYVTSTDPSSPLYDPTCQGNGCLPEDAPCDATVPCCDGLTCDAGVCVIADGDDCAAAPCQNGGTCTDGVNSYSCACAPGYTGTNCETAVNLCSEPCPLPAWADDECTVVTCDPGTGVCGDPDYFTHYKELCNDGMGVCQGGVCHLDLCLASPCQNDGQCFGTYGSGTYTCSCPSGYTGTNCEEIAVTCPCESAFADFVYASVYDTCFVDGSHFDISFDTGPYVGVYGGNCYFGTTSSGVFPVDAEQEQACRDLLLTLDQTSLAICAP